MKLIHELIAGYAGMFPDKTAVSDENTEMSYRELEAMSRAVSRILAQKGVKAGDTAAVYVPYAKEILLGAVSAFRTGCIFVPFDGEYPIKRLEYMLEDSKAAVIMTTREFWESRKLDFPEGRVIFLDGIQEYDGSGPDPADLTDDSPAMLLYTSGTTGRPKGVLHTHRMLLHIADTADNYDETVMNAGSRCGIMSGFPFVATQMFVLGPLAKGGTVCIAPEAARKDTELLYRFLKGSGITHVFMPSSMAAIMAEDYDLGGIFVYAAGEKLRNFRSFCPGNILINLYGSTEVGPIIAKKIRGDEERILVGKPCRYTKTMIVDEDRNPVKPGETGELLVSSDYMSPGYFMKPDLSAEKWTEKNGTRWFQTGDRARCTPDGDYDILGRTDNMIKLRGFRIETGEVEVQVSSALNRLGRNDVGQIVAVLRTVGGTEHLCCYYETKEGIDKKAVAKEASEYLADYMIPDVWVRLDALPRNANGKVMRNELPQPKRERAACEALESEVLARLVYAAEDVLDTEEMINPDDRFTDLGGTSITAMKYAALLREQGIRISGAQVLQYNVLRKIAEEATVSYEQLWSHREYREVQEDFALRGEKIVKVLPISSRQDEMLFEEIIHPEWSNQKNVLFFQLDSTVSEETLRRALDIVADENEELRAAMVFHDVTVIQQVITDRRIPIEMVRAGTFGSSEMAELRNRLLHTTMDLQRDSLMKVICLVTESESFLCIVHHRIAFRKEKLRGYLARLMGLLEESYPDDVSIRGWEEIFETASLKNLSEEQKTADRSKALQVKSVAPPDICVYSEGRDPKLVFVHTANTGSAAYYRLADRIGELVSFAVIEPFNLYHMEKAVYGIRNIAKKYIEILKAYQPEGPYILGGWCYGGMVAHEMACHLAGSGEEVRHLIMFDTHAATTEKLREMSKAMLAQINRGYFETSPLFADLRESGMLEAMVENAAHVTDDMYHHIPSFYNGDVLYFKPEMVPKGITGGNLRYWQKMMEFEAGYYENYCDREKLKIVRTPHEHDLMMDDPSLDIIVPELIKKLAIS